MEEIISQLFRNEKNKKNSILCCVKPFDRIKRKNHIEHL